MKIFSNFDTNLSTQLCEEAREKYGEDGFFFVRRDPIYPILKVYIPILIRFLVCGILLMLYYIWWMDGSAWSDILWILIWTIVISRAIYLFYFATDKLVDFYMDYAIITSKQITMYDQDGILRRVTNALDTSKIKTINIDMDWLLCSIFNYGSIVILAEGDRLQGDIKLNYIGNPVHFRDRLLALVDLGDKQEEEE